MNKLHFARRFLLNKTHWYCLYCGDFHRYSDLREGCPLEALEKEVNKDFHISEDD